MSDSRIVSAVFFFNPWLYWLVFLAIVLLITLITSISLLSAFKKNDKYFDKTANKWVDKKTKNLLTGLIVGSSIGLLLIVLGVMSDPFSRKIKKSVSLDKFLTYKEFLKK